MILSADFPDGFRAAATLRGFNFGVGRQPLSENQKVDINTLSRVLQCIMSDFSIVGAPSEGCSTRSGNLNTDRVTQLTERVIQELRAQGVL